jgi:serine O-acetyltransferase
MFKIVIGCLNPRFVPVLLYRFMYRSAQSPIPGIARLFSLLNVLLFGIEIAQRCPIGPGLYLPHTHGTVIGAESIGANAVIFQNVTLGAAELDLSYAAGTRPWVGDNVTIGAGAKIIGGVRIGNNCVIGANAVVLCDLEPGSIAVGVPARVVKIVAIPALI